jgi:hypothetical protein
MQITPEGLAAVYDCLRAFPPFKGWRLPPSDAVEFRVLKTKQYHGAFWSDGETPVLEVSETKHRHFSSLAETVGHEMIHLHQRLDRTETPNAEHNAAFHRASKLVCRRFGWDEGQFLG